jgi:hypothetical protein
VSLWSSSTESKEAGSALADDGGRAGPANRNANRNANRASDSLSNIPLESVIICGFTFIHIFAGSPWGAWVFNHHVADCVFGKCS